MPTKTGQTRPREGLGLTSAMPERKTVTTTKPARNRNRVVPPKLKTHRSRERSS